MSVRAVHRGRASGPLTRVPPGIKMVGLLVFGVVTYVLPGWPAQLILLVTASVAYGLSGPDRSRLPRTLMPLLIFVAVVFTVTTLTADLAQARLAALRLATLLLFALAVTASTRTTELLDVFDRALAPLARFGVPPRRVSLALALTVRFVPEIRTRYDEIREAQYARGLQNRPVAVLVPLLVRTFTDAEDIAAALDARCYDLETEPSSGADPDQAREVR